MKRKEAVYKGLQFVPVWFEDTSLTSPDYFQITEFPTRLTAGKNLFKLRGHPTNLRPGSYLNIEVLDYNGDPIYSEIVNFIDEDKSRVIAIFIYEETSPGDCTITVTGEAINVPADWQGKSNIKWTRTVPVNPNVSNISEIIFEQIPELVISENVGVHLDRVYSPAGQFPTYSSGTVRYFLYNNQPAIELIGGTFTNDMSTGTLTVPSPVNPTPTPNFPISTTTYTSTIKKILTGTVALLDTEYTAYSSQSISQHTYTEFAASSYSIAYEATPEYVATQNSESFALMQIKGLDPATGDVSRVKVFMNNTGTVGTWELLNDVELDETEMFIASTASLYPDTSIGMFVTQSTINTYWQGITYVNSAVSSAPILTWTTQSLNNSMLIQNTANISALNSVTVAKINSAYNGIFIANSEYKITLDAIGTVSGSSTAKLSLYLSGSAFDYNPTDYFNQEFPVKFGKRVGELQIAETSQRWDDTVFNFTADHDGDGVLLLVAEEGLWQVADIRTTTDNDAGYSPNYTRLRTLVPTAHKSKNQLTFKAEYYNVNGEKSKQISYVYNKDWAGGNRYIDGDYSMLTGSLYVADSLETGVAISGYKNTGFIRSLGYEGFTAGFPGFLLWSGSALSGSLGTKGGVPYSGVGLELYANTSSYFRYSTTDSEIDVRTDKFFFGQYPAPFISGANGNIEISASNFHLSAEGNVTASNALFTGVALANVIRDKTVIITNANSGSYLQNYIENDFTNTPAVRIVMDGSLGGEIVRRVRVNIALSRPIGDFLLPSIGATERIDFILETVFQNKILDTFFNRTAPPTTYDQITLDEAAVITLVTAGNTGDSYFITAGTENPLDFSFKRNLKIGDGDTNGGILTISSSGVAGGSGVNQPRIQLKNNSYGQLNINPANVSSTTATIIGNRTLGNWGQSYTITNNSVAIRPYIAVSGSANGQDRRILINGATHYGQRVVTATGGSPDITLETSDSIIICNHSSGTMTIDLGTPTDADAGRIIRIINRQTGTVTITGGIYIAGSAAADTSRTTSTQYASIQLLAPGSSSIAGWISINETGTWS
jgi:hypothetical protein